MDEPDPHRTSHNFQPSQNQQNSARRSIERPPFQRPSELLSRSRRDTSGQPRFINGQGLLITRDAISRPTAAAPCGEEAHRMTHNHKENDLCFSPQDTQLRLDRHPRTRDKSEQQPLPREIHSMSPRQETPAVMTYGNVSDDRQSDPIGEWPHDACFDACAIPGTAGFNPRRYISDIAKEPDYTTAAREGAEEFLLETIDSNVGIRSKTAHVVDSVAMQTLINERLVTQKRHQLRTIQDDMINGANAMHSDSLEVRSQTAALEHEQQLVRNERTIYAKSFQAHQKALEDLSRAHEEIEKIRAEYGRGKMTTKAEHQKVVSERDSLQSTLDKLRSALEGKESELAAVKNILEQSNTRASQAESDLAAFKASTPKSEGSSMTPHSSQLSSQSTNSFGRIFGMGPPPQQTGFGTTNSTGSSSWLTPSSLSRGTPPQSPSHMAFGNSSFAIQGTPSRTGSFASNELIHTLHSEMGSMQMGPKTCSPDATVADQDPPKSTELMVSNSGLENGPQMFGSSSPQHLPFQQRRHPGMRSVHDGHDHHRLLRDGWATNDSIGGIAFGEGRQVPTGPRARQESDASEPMHRQTSLAAVATKRRRADSSELERHTLDDIFSLLDVLDANESIIPASTLPMDLKNAFKAHLTKCMQDEASFKVLTAKSRVDTCLQNKFRKEKDSSMLLPVGQACHDCSNTGRLCLRKKKNANRGCIVPQSPASRHGVAWDDPAYWFKLVVL